MIYDAVVVGAGMAGLTSAAYLCKSGRRILLCERGAKAGGLVGSFEQGGFTFDSGIRAFENSGIVFPMLKELGIDMEFASDPVSVGVEDKLVKLSSKNSLSDYMALLEGTFPENSYDIGLISGEIKKVIGYMDVLYGIDNPLFVDYSKDREYLFRTLLPWLFKYQINIRKASKLKEPVNTYLRRFTENKALIDMITQHFFKDTPTFFALSYFGLYLDYSYPVGGTGVLADRIVALIKKHGGELLYNTEISGIDLPNKNVITVDGRTFGYKKLVWAGDMKALYRAVQISKLPNRRLRDTAEVQKKAVLSGSGGDSVLSIYVAVSTDKDFFKNTCGAHCFYTPCKTGLSAMDPEGWKKIADESSGTVKKDKIKKWIKRFLELTTYEISCPALRDNKLAPEGCTGVIISTLMDYSLIKYISEEGWYEECKNFCKEAILSILDGSLFPKIKEKIIFSKCSTPLSIERLTGNSEGAITGWAFTNKNMPAENDFKRIAKSVNTPLPDIYQAGQWSFCPSGLPVSILTGKLAADAVIKGLKVSMNIDGGGL